MHWQVCLVPQLGFANSVFQPELHSVVKWDSFFHLPPPFLFCLIIILYPKPFDFSASCGFVHFSANISMAKKQTLPTFLLLYGCMIFLSQATALYRSRFELWQVFVLMLLLHSSARRLFDCPHCQPTHFYWQGELMKNPCQTSKHWDVKHSSWTIIILK